MALYQYKYVQIQTRIQLLHKHNNIKDVHKQTIKVGNNKPTQQKRDVATTFVITIIRNNAQRFIIMSD